MICLTNRAEDTFYLFTPTSRDNAPVELQSKSLCAFVEQKFKINSNKLSMQQGVVSSVSMT